VANTFKNAATGSNTTINAMYTCPGGTNAVVHAMYLSNIDGENSATINLSISGSANFDHRTYILKTVEVPADTTVIIEKPINLGAGDKLETQASADGDIEAFASILEIT
jgi:ACT domain-containing protein